MGEFRRGHAELSRRHVLRLMAGGAGLAAGASMAACGRDEEEREAPNGSGGDGDRRVSLFTTLSTPGDESFYNEWLDRFTEETGIEVERRFQPEAQYGEALQLSFQSGEEADVFRMAKAQGRIDSVFDKGWVQPLSEFSVVTDTLGEHYPESALDPLISGLHRDGELYAVPSIAHRGQAVARPLMVNVALLDEYGIEGVPQTHAEVEEAAIKITTDSREDVFGFTIVGNSPFGVKFQPFQNACGPAMGGKPLDYQTGRSGAGHPSWIEAVAFLRRLVESGTMAPGWQTMSPEAFMQSFAQERIAMAVIPPWWANEITKANPDIQLEFSGQPIPDDGRRGYTAELGNPGKWSPQFGMSRSADNPEAAAELIAFLARPEVQRAYYDATGLVPALAETFVDDLNEVWQKIIPLTAEIVREGPNPAVRNTEAPMVRSSMFQNMGDTIEGLVFSAVDAGDDYEGPASEYDDEFDAVIDEAIAEAEGSGVTRATFEFPDWDPLEDYVAESG